MTAPRIHVVAAVLQRDECVFVQQRQPGKHMAGLWEFPGGKVERDESPWSALVRELAEELGISATSGEPLIQLTHTYPDREVFLDVWRVTNWDGEVRALEQQTTSWCALAELETLPLLPADGPVIDAVSLPHQILITPDCQTSFDEFLQQLEASVRRFHTRLCILRQTQLSAHDYDVFATRAAKILRELECELVLHGLSDRTRALSERLDAYALHVTARSGMALKAKPVGIKRLSMSCHSAQELGCAEELGVHFALLGSVQATATHPSGPILGWKEFKQIVATANVPVFAVGGMKPEDEVPSRLQGGQGIAAIRALWAS